MNKKTLSDYKKENAKLRKELRSKKFLSGISDKEKKQNKILKDQYFWKKYVDWLDIPWLIKCYEPERFVAMGCCSHIKWWYYYYGTEATELEKKLKENCEKSEKDRELLVSKDAMDKIIKEKDDEIDWLERIIYRREDMCFISRMMNHPAVDISNMRDKVMKWKWVKKKPDDEDAGYPDTFSHFNSHYL